MLILGIAASQRASMLFSMERSETVVSLSESCSYTGVNFSSSYLELSARAGRTSGVVGGICISLKKPVGTVKV